MTCEFRVSGVVGQVKELEINQWVISEIVRTIKLAAASNNTGWIVLEVASVSECHYDYERSTWSTQPHTYLQERVFLTVMYYLIQQERGFLTVMYYLIQKQPSCKKSMKAIVKKDESKVVAKNGCDGRLIATILIMTIFLNLCCLLHVSLWFGIKLLLLKFLLLVYYYSHSWPAPWISHLFSQWPLGWLLTSLLGDF